MHKDGYGLGVPDASRFLAPRTFLGGLNAEDFLRHHWQKEPLLVRAALPDYCPPVEPDELAGLACEAEVESRVVVFDGTTWHLENGPFKADSFPRRGTRDWTLLVQDLDEHLPDVGSLLQHLDFLPSFRVDDIMASFAAEGGSVGPHYDEYDVFLLQVQGSRRWQISTSYARDDLRSDSELRLLNNFKAEREWVLGPGDLLYLPPHVAHFGVAQDACMTFSLGCRAPSHTDLLAQFAGMVLNEFGDADRYRDPDLSWDEHQSGLSVRAQQRTRAILEQALTCTPSLVARCLGSVTTQPKAIFRNDSEELTDSELDAALTSPGGLWRRKGSRWSWCQLEQGAYLFVDGREIALSGSYSEGLARHLCSNRHFEQHWLQGLVPEARTVVQQLTRDGQLHPDE